jgi:polyphosphate kinase
LCIVSLNLDEFFEVRMALHLRARDAGQVQGPFTATSYARVSKAAKALILEQYRIFNEELQPELRRAKISILPSARRNEAQKRWTATYFDQEIRPALLPIFLDPAHPFPQIATKTLNFICSLSGRTIGTTEFDLVIVRVPRSLPRMIRLPTHITGQEAVFVTLSSVIRSELATMFPGRMLERFAQFRLTRDSHVMVDEEDVLDLRKALRDRLEQRPYGQPVRLEVSANCAPEIENFLLEQCGLPTQALYRVNGPVNLARLNQIIELAKAPELLFPRYEPQGIAQPESGKSFFDLLNHGDLLVHQPYESFDTLIEFVRQAVDDPAVVAIKQTVYRIGSDPLLMDLLKKAVTKGIEVTLVVELQARFDEENNLLLSEQLEQSGVQVLYGLPGLKTHAKMLLVTRKEGRKFRWYGHLSTGNYNRSTAKLYTDFGHFTANKKLLRDMLEVFLYLANRFEQPSIKTILLAPFTLQSTILSMVERARLAALAGKSCRIVAKMNALTDQVIANALIQAVQSGVKVDLIVRGACILPSGQQTLPGLRIRSVIGRFLEHTRAFYVRVGRSEQLWLSSADWMNRNMTRRVEIAWPITDRRLRQRIVAECLSEPFKRHSDVWAMGPNLEYQRVVPKLTDDDTGVQGKLIRKYAKSP